MEEKKIICTVCPMGCNITVRGNSEKIEDVEGFTCKRGKEYACNEFTNPVRILTSTVKVEGSAVPLVSVRSAKPVPKKMLMDCMAEINKIKVKAPVNTHDVIIQDILGTGVDIISTCRAD